jgi:hypothetical protein
MSHETEHAVVGGAAGLESSKLAPQADAEVLKMGSEDVSKSSSKAAPAV